MTVERIATDKARLRLSELSNRVRYGGESFILLNHGKACAALVPLRVLEAVQAAPVAQDAPQAASPAAPGGTP